MDIHRIVYAQHLPARDGRVLCSRQLHGDHSGRVLGPVAERRDVHGQLSGRVLQRGHCGVCRASSEFVYPAGSTTGLHLHAQRVFGRKRRVLPEHDRVHHSAPEY